MTVRPTGPSPILARQNQVASAKDVTSAAPPLPQDSVLSSTVTEVPFDGFLKFKKFDVDVKIDGAIQKYLGGFVHGPGHHIAAVAAFAFDEAMTPHPILKTGDTRLARAERSQPYVLDGFIAGRMDKKGAESSKIALAELAEEVGGEVVGDTFRPLGNVVSPTMPNESTESDNYYVAAVEIKSRPSGDGSEMEALDIIGPKLSSPTEALRSMDAGEVSEGGRSRTLFGRGFDSMGFVPQLNAYVQDIPKLAARFDTLGLGEPVDPRGQVKASRFPKPAPPSDALEAQINDVVSHQRRSTEVQDQFQMVDATTRHAVNKNGTITEVGNEFPNQYLKLDYDRAKIASYYIDENRGPMVEMQKVVRPALAFAPESPKVVRRDVADVKISRDRDSKSELPEGVRMLGQPSGASAGQSDLYYHYAAQDVGAPPSDEQSAFVTLAEAITLCRTGDGDSQTEALFERLADDLNWIPNLGMTVAEAKELMK